MSITVHVTDPANAYHLDLSPHRTAWHLLQGTTNDALSGNISRVFLTGVPLSVTSHEVVQDSDYCCGGAAIAIAIGKTKDAECHQWLESRGYMQSSCGTYYEGIGACLNAYGYSCSYDGVGYDGQMTGTFYTKIINHLKSGYKVIVCMHGVKKGGRTNFWTNYGHYVVIDGISDSSSTTTTTTTSSTTTTFAPGTVASGVNGRDTFILQCILESRGLYDKKYGLDGIAGTNTVASIKAYQKARKLTVDGRAGDKTWGDILGTGKGSIALTTVQSGSKNLSALFLQEIMSAFGYYSGNLDMDIGTKSVAGIKKLQTYLKVTVDGIFGPKSWTALLKKTKI